MANYGYNSVPANYINQYSTLQQDHIDQLREEILGNREDFSTKNKKLSAETNKRRRDLVNKKRARETEEELRRKEILAERKARIQDVTSRYQRGSAATKPNNSHQRSKATRSRRAVSAPVTRSHQINLDDALRTIRGNNQQQYNVGDSSTVFLQKYGAHLQTLNNDATNKHSQSVRQHSNHGNSMFEQQLLQHQATLRKTNVDTSHYLIQEMNSTGPPTSNIAEDNQSVESLDSLDSEQPSFRSHVINSKPEPAISNTSTNNNVLDMSGGGGTYRQESPTVLVNDSNSAKANITQPKATVNVTETNTFHGFQVVNPADSKPMIREKTTPQQSDISNLHSSQVHGAQANDESKQNTANNAQNSVGVSSFYLKSRTESQSSLVDFPTHAWSTHSISDKPHPYLPTDPPLPQNEPLLAKNTGYTDTFSDTASDSGAPRSILKKREAKSSTLPRSQSTPSIRDSLEVTKQHMKSTRVETPQSAKKSVRFCEAKSEPVLFQKGSSPSSIPRPVNKPKKENNVPHISSAITPNVSDKSICSKPSNPTKGPVVANHNIAVASPAKEATSPSKPSMLDIRLDKTPTDDEIDLLWDKVRDCLLDSPASSIRSAPAELQPATPSPVKQPIKKITASNINQIGRAQSASARLRTTSESSQSPLQRPKQDQKSFLHHNESARSQFNGGIVTQQRMNGQTTPIQTGPTQSALEPNMSAMVNNAPQDVSESMRVYLAAEQLAGHESLSDQDIMKVMADAEYRQELNGNGRPVVPMSALSMEEHRILQSLDRLNEKLKVVEEGSHSHRSNQSDYQQSMSSPASTSSTLYNGVTPTNHGGFANTLTSQKVLLKPHPPNNGGTSQRSFSATSRGFRGHKPIQPRQRTASADVVRQHNNMTSPALSGVNRQFRLY